MIIYWLIFAFPAFATLHPLRIDQSLSRFVWILLGAVLTLLIGFRFEVGGDWHSYLQFHSRVENMSVQQILGEKDIGYAILNWLAGKIGGEIYLVNLICGLIITTGVISFSRRQPLPWLSVVVSVPYMIIVVAMGYTRQSAAIGFELLALVALMDDRVKRFIVLIICGAFFHKSAIILLPLAVLSHRKKRIWTLFWILVTGTVFGLAILIEHYEGLWLNYVVEKMVSEGGPVRIAMNAVPAVLLLIYHKKLTPHENERRLWLWIAVFSLACIPLVSSASTAVDRVALYFMPIQPYVFSRIHRLSNSTIFKTLAVVFVVLGYSMVQWTWLNYASHAFAWLPYQFYPLVFLF